MSDENQHIVGLTISNIKKLTAVKIGLDLKQRTVVISGENGAGKSSVLDSIEMALAGKSSIPSKPIRDGKETARIVLETEKMIITRTFSTSGNYLKCENKEGFKASSPQSLLDNMIAMIGFDPLSFANMKDDQQGRELLGIFPTKINLEENANFVKGAYDERQIVNREIKQVAAQIAGFGIFPDHLPTVEISISALSQESTKLRGELEGINRSKTEVTQITNMVKSHNDKIALLKKHIGELEEAVNDWNESLKELKEKEIREPAVIQQELEALDKKIQSAEQVNARVREKHVCEARKKHLSEIEAKSAKYSKQIEELANARADALKEAKFPVDGLSIDENGKVILNGVPFGQASMAQKLIVGIAVAAASNNKLRVCLIRDASLLDAKSMKLVAEMAQKKDIQIWMERVEDNSPVAVQIVEGSNIGAADAPEVETPADAKKEPATAATGEFSLGGIPTTKKTRKKASPTDNVDPFKA